MSNKNKTVSFRVNQDSFEKLRSIAEERDLSLSALFRDYVDMLIAHDGKVEVVPEHETTVSDRSGSDEFPPTVEVPTSFVREHERLELEAKHLREQLDEYKEYVTHLQDRIDNEEQKDVIQLEDLDRDLHTADDDNELRPDRSDYR
ncbi:CopG family transcriptional regulator [Salinarchaeum sp. IM2453]|uniref:CopG family transcriptional regulator n=1 Tax=Salinarchaeum sp. IM2453 TaxID=2862870 RepID=UPI001C838ED2|nr:CopG family transcriptional regulator [Salinarchaeum sp. IM2453]QZA89487.1 CopG family transcriptional regulator [Salinarchaeum sp. IM2453]